MRVTRAILVTALAFIVFLLVAFSILRSLALAGPEVGPGPRPIATTLAVGGVIEQTFFMPPREFGRVTLR
ncbi:MAG: hypothetical protein IMZ55_11225, partial [Acidobacteria bacterium]|nr:hypothetical protein [Acidobacteriota bacterium]